MKMLKFDGHQLNQKFSSNKEMRDYLLTWVKGVVEVGLNAQWAHEDFSPTLFIIHEENGKLHLSFATVSQVMDTRESKRLFFKHIAADLIKDMKAQAVLFMSEVNYIKREKNDYKGELPTECDDKEDALMMALYGYDFKQVFMFERKSPLTDLNFGTQEDLNVSNCTFDTLQPVREKSGIENLFNEIKSN